MRRGHFSPYQHPVMPLVVCPVGQEADIPEGPDFLGGLARWIGNAMNGVSRGLEHLYLPARLRVSPPRPRSLQSQTAGEDCVPGRGGCPCPPTGRMSGGPGFWSLVAESPLFSSLALQGPSGREVGQRKAKATRPLPRTARGVPWARRSREASSGSTPSRRAGASPRRAPLPSGRPSQRECRPRG